MHSEPLRPITQAEIESFREDGVVLLRGMFAAEWVDAVAAALERSLERTPLFGTDFASTLETDGRFQSDVLLWLGDETLRSYVFESPAIDIACTLLGCRERLSFFNDQTFIKEPGTAVPTPWHQDQPFWPVRGEQVCSFWMTCDPVGPDDSALEFVAGSHRWGTWFKAVTPDNDPHLLASDFEYPPDIEAARDRYRILSWDYEPGDLVVFHGLTLHGSRGNSSTTRRRRAYSTRWCGDDTTYDARPATYGLPPGEQFEDGAPFIADFWPLVWDAEHGRRKAPALA